MTKPVRYQEGHLYVHHDAWYVRYRERVRQEDGSIKLQQKANRLGSLKDYPGESLIKPLLAEFLCKLNAGNFTPEPGMTLTEFVEKIYLPYLQEKRASTKKGYEEIWNNHIRDRVGNIQLRNFRTVNASRMLRAVADENDLSKTTLQHIKGVLSLRACSAAFLRMRRTKARSMVRIRFREAVSRRTHGNRPRHTRTTWLRFVGFSSFCRCFPKQSSRRRLLPAYGEANCSGWNERIIRVTL